MSSTFDTTVGRSESQIMGRPMSQLDSEIAAGMVGPRLLSGSRLDTAIGQYSQSSAMGQYSQSGGMSFAMPDSSQMGQSVSLPTPTRPPGLPVGARFFICESVYRRDLTCCQKVHPRGQNFVNVNRRGHSSYKKWALLQMGRRFQYHDSSWCQGPAAGSRNSRGMRGPIAFLRPNLVCLLGLCAMPITDKIIPGTRVAIKTQWAQQLIVTRSPSADRYARRSLEAECARERLNFACIRATTLSPQCTTDPFE